MAEGIFQWQRRTGLRKDRRPKVSVILPVWNPGKGIQRCIDSLRRQSLKQIELIFVDDCGTDQSMELVCAAAGEDPRIRIMTNAGHAGAGASRNAGILAAKGEYLSFIDPDDYVAPDFLELLYRKARKDRLDIVKGSLKLIRDTDVPDQQRFMPGGLNRKLKLFRLLGLPAFAAFSHEHTSALYKRKYLLEHSAVYGHTSCSEDTTFLLRACTGGGRFGIEAHAVYYYVMRSASAVGQIGVKRLKGRAEALREQIDCLLKKHLTGSAAEYYIIDRVLDCLLLGEAAENVKGLEKDAARYRQEIRAELSRFPDRERLMKKNAVIRALLESGENLVTQPYQLKGLPAGIPQWISLLRRRTIWSRRHPKAAVRYRHLIEESFGGALTALLAQIRRDGRAAPDTVRQYRAVSRLAGKLPPEVNSAGLRKQLKTARRFMTGKKISRLELSFLLRAVHCRKYIRKFSTLLW